MYIKIIIKIYMYILGGDIQLYENKTFLAIHKNCYSVRHFALYHLLFKRLE